LSAAGPTVAAAKKRLSRTALALLAIVLLGFELRIESVLHSVVENPVRGDAREYVLYAYNLEHHGVYSHAAAAPGDVPVPDAMRVPGYPLFLTLFFSDAPTAGEVRSVLVAQALLGTATIVLAFLLARMFLAPGYALIAATLTAVSPHLVTMSIYLLTETLLAALIVLALVVSALAARRGGLWPLPAGLTLAAAALTHPMMLYFVVPVALYLLLRERWAGGLRKTAWLVVGFSVLYGPWVARNLWTLGAAGDSTLMLVALRGGAYTDLMYQSDPATFGYPYRADPAFAETSRDLRSVLREIARSFEENPAAQLRWYLIGKTLRAWSWDNIEGQGDVFVYPTASSPYMYLPHFRATHRLMYLAHWPLMALAALGLAGAWLFPRSLRLDGPALFTARLLALLLLYHAAVMTAGFPIPRYSIAVRPALFALALLPIAATIRAIADRRAAHRIR
jgi:4-amino-4-deoxy-L-arabinose transferase-like glycosyltransferase